jgi:hypothetical protein
MVNHIARKQMAVEANQKTKIKVLEKENRTLNKRIVKHRRSMVEKLVQ